MMRKMRRAYFEAQTVKKPPTSKNYHSPCPPLWGRYARESSGLPGRGTAKRWVRFQTAYFYGIFSNFQTSSVSPSGCHLPQRGRLNREFLEIPISNSNMQYTSPARQCGAYLFPRSFGFACGKCRRARNIFAAILSPRLHAAAHFAIIMSGNSFTERTDTSCMF